MPLAPAKTKRHYRSTEELGGLGGDHYKNRKDKMFSARMSADFFPEAQAFLSSRDVTKKDYLENLLRKDMEEAGWISNGPRSDCTKPDKKPDNAPKVL